MVPTHMTSGLLPAAQAAPGCVLVGSGSSTAEASSALPCIHLDVARDGQRHMGRH
jgi:hypothetical protein